MAALQEAALALAGFALLEAAEARVLAAAGTPEVV